MPAKEFYRTYLADNLTDKLNTDLANLVASQQPNHVFEFGCGTGKNLRLIHRSVPKATLAGLDISHLNIIHAQVIYPPGFMYACADEFYLRNLCNFDVVITCSVLDHIEDVDKIIGELKRIANKAIYIAETKDVPAPYYYTHDYESFGFKRVHGTRWVSELPNGDGCAYYIWEWLRSQAGPDDANDDMA